MPILAWSSLLQNSELQIVFPKDDEGNYLWKVFMSKDEIATSSNSYTTKELCINNLIKIASHVVEQYNSGKLT